MSNDAVEVIKSQSSVEVSKTAKGVVTFSVKSYDDDIEIAKNKAVKVFSELNEEYFNE